VVGGRMSKDLSLISRDELLSELEKRYDCCLFAGLQDLSHTDEQAFFNWKGGKFNVIGLNHAFINKMQRNIEKAEEDK
jgi:hypothetical protein